MKENVVLCGANSYVEKYYFNERFKALPEEVKQELQIMCVLFTENAGGTLTMEFTPAGDLIFNVTQDEGDYLFDEIESELQIRKMSKEHEELLTKLETYYKALSQLAQ